MNINIDEEVLKAYIEETVNKKVDFLTDKIIEDKIQDALFERIDSVFGHYGDKINYYVKEYTREIIEKQVPPIDKALLEEVGEGVARSIIWGLRDDVLSSIAYKIMPDNEKEEEEY